MRNRSKELEDIRQRYITKLITYRAGCIAIRNEERWKEELEQLKNEFNSKKYWWMKRI